MATFWALRAALWEDYSVTLLRISGFQKSVNVLLHTQIIPDVLLQDFAAVIAAAELQILKTGRTNPVTECKLSFSLSHEIKWSLLAQERDLLGGKFMFQRRCPLSATQNEQVRVSCVLQTLCGQKGEAKVLAERRITWAAKAKLKVSDWGCCVSPLEAVMWAWAQLLTLLLVVFSRCCSYELMQATNCTWRGSWPISTWSMMEDLWMGELGLFSPFTGQISRHCLLKGSCDCRITAPCFSMSHLELSYSKGHDLCHPAVTGSAIHLGADWELDIIWLETYL